MSHGEAEINRRLTNMRDLFDDVQFVNQMLQRVHRRESTRIRFPASPKGARERTRKQIRELRGNGILGG